MNSRFRLSAVLSTAAVAAVLAFAGCGGGGDDSGSGADPATAAPADTQIFVEGTVKPAGDTKTNIEQLVDTATNGQVDAGQQIIDQINASFAGDPDTKDLTYESDIEPWLGEKAGIALAGYDGEDFEDYSAALQVTDSGSASDFFDKVKEQGENIGEGGSYEGYDYVTDTEDDTVIGLGDDFFVLGSDLANFKAAVDAAAGGDSLDSDSSYTDAISHATSGSLATVYVDIGGMIKDAGQSVDQQVLDFYKALGVDFSDATAVASLVPNSDNLEVDFATNASESFGGDPSSLMASFPGDTIAGFASAGVGEQLQSALEGINEVGFPPEVPKGALFQTLDNAGINVKSITSKIGDVGLFVNGSGLANIGGALIVTTDSEKTASDTVKRFTLFLRRAGAPGFSVLKGNQGFSVTNTDLPRPLVVTFKGDRILAGLGLAQTLAAASGNGATLGDNDKFKDAQSALGGEKISGFIDADPLIALGQLSGDPSFDPARPFRETLAYLAVGYGSDNGFATSKVILALNK